MSSPLRIGRIKSASTMFFMCDVQEKFRTVISYFPSVVHVSQRMITASRLLNIPMVVSEQNPSRLGNTVSELDVQGHMVHEKMLFSMLTPEVELFLQEKKTESAVIFGLESHVCVLQTTLDLLERGLTVHVLADGVSSRKNGDRFISFERMRQSGAFVTTSESLLFQLIHDAKHPAFKEISNLVKGQAPETGLTKTRTESDEESSRL